MNFPIPPMKVEPLSIETADKNETDKINQRLLEHQQFQEFQSNQHTLLPPIQLPPAPEQLPTLNYHQIQNELMYYQQLYHQHSIQQQLNQIQPVNYINIPTQWSQPPPPEYLDPRKSIDLKLIRIPKKKDKRCYTCKPRGKIKQHIINTSSSGKYTFHHDIHKRPVIIVTPIRHVEQIYELSNEEMADMMSSISEFSNLWNIKDYQISINVGSWQDADHSHLHVKLRIPEKTINRMRRDHFEKNKLEKDLTKYDIPIKAFVNAD
jgi:diadenosine tetraphosphate (Ap4A) HIT family hydrolase